MNDDKTPEQKIQALFFQALLPADKNLKPSDIVVSIEAHPAAKTSPALSSDRSITIDLSKTSFSKHTQGMSFGLMECGGNWASNPADGLIVYRGNGLMENANVKQLQTAMAGSIMLSSKIAEPLGAAARGRSVA